MLNRLLLLLVILVGCNDRHYNPGIVFAGCWWPVPPSHDRNDVNGNIFFTILPDGYPMTRVSFKQNDELIQLGADIRKHIRNIDISEVDDYIISEFEYGGSENFKGIEGHEVVIIQDKNTLESVVFYNINHHTYFDMCLRYKNDASPPMTSEQTDDKV